MADYVQIQDQDFSFFGKGSKIKGVFNLNGPTYLSSQVEGEIHMEDQAHLLIERTGTFFGSINCHNIEIYGKFEGNLEASGKVTIYPPAILKGKIQAGELVVHPGAVLNIDGHTVS